MKELAKTIQQIAQGELYSEKALKEVLKFNHLTDAEVKAVQNYLQGSQTSSDRFRLQTIAIKVNQNDFQSVAELLEAVDKGLTVHWHNTGYRVIKDSTGMYFLSFPANGYNAYLLDQNGKLRENLYDFFLGE